MSDRFLLHIEPQLCHVVQIYRSAIPVGRVQAQRLPALHRLMFLAWRLRCCTSNQR